MSLSLLIDEIQLYKKIYTKIYCGTFNYFVIRRYRNYKYTNEELEYIIIFNV